MSNDCCVGANFVNSGVQTDPEFQTYFIVYHIQKCLSLMYILLSHLFRLVLFWLL